jgi:adenylate kinase family enzyme
MKIKIRIIGPCGSGKSYIAREISKKYGINYFELDNLVWNRNVENLKNSAHVRGSMLNEILEQDSWIIEGVHYKWGFESFRGSDLIFVIKPNQLVSQYRAVRRFIRTRLGLEQWNYKQSLKNLWIMLFDWNKGYYKHGFKNILDLTAEFAEKRIIIGDNREILKNIQERLVIQEGNDIT